ncbi:murein transglycosylase A [Glycocaulis albus]|uniref:murein transglycosylase A n=1 Tax=Glycocaulis albus TaxID=1382801 RepID=UPI001F1C3CFA|nr:MltA domain-containing protein [Glycocaulis albus]
MSRATTRTGGFPPCARPSALAALCLTLVLTACASVPDAPSTGPRPPAASSLDLRVLPGFDALEGWQTHDARAALSSFGQSCTAILRRPADRPLNDRAPHAGRAGDWHDVCREALSLLAGNLDARSARQFFEARFRPVAVGGEGRLTGYYEPMVEARYYPDPEFSMAIRARPGLSPRGDMSQLIAGLDAARFGGADEARPRAEIEAMNIGVPLAWGRPIDVFFMQIQGSGRLVFDDGYQRRAAFAAHNGHPYVSIGRLLLDRGELPPGQASKHHIENWLIRNGPTAWTPLFNENPRYVFFDLQEIADPGAGPMGSQGVPLTPMASLAIDPAFHAWGVPVFIQGEVSGQGRWNGLVIAQDAGGAITGPVRGDLFFGWGDEAGQTAGRQNSFARWHLLLPSHLAARLARTS